MMRTGDTGGFVVAAGVRAPGGRVRVSARTLARLKRFARQLDRARVRHALRGAARETDLERVQVPSSRALVDWWNVD